MGYFDFLMSEVHGLRIKELLDEKEQGRTLLRKDYQTDGVIHYGLQLMERPPDAG
jgi:hypothetical protein